MAEKIEKHSTVFVMIVVIRSQANVYCRKSPVLLWLYILPWMKAHA